MQSVGRRYVRYFNDEYERTGTLWEGRYWAAPIDTERYLLACYRYIELNPVRACLVGSPADYEWSSFRANAFGEMDPLVSPHDVYRSLGSDAYSRQAEYVGLFEERLDESTIAEIREATNKRWALGTPEFCQRIEALAVRRARPGTGGGARSGAGRRGTRSRP
jgi:putative transposase